MPFFNFRRASSTSSGGASAAQPESMDVVRKRAKHRLIGASVLVLAGVVGFPLLFDTQPRPIDIDMPIEIPGKNTVKPLALPAKPAVGAAALPATKQSPTPSPAPDALTVTTASSLTPKEEVVTDKAPGSLPGLPNIPAAAPKSIAPTAPKIEAKIDSRPAVKAETKPEPKSESKPASKAGDGARAKALLDGQASLAATPAALTEGRKVVQVGAFADADKANDVRQRLEKAGLKTYTHVADTKDGKRIRVRVGPFDSKAEADKAASKIKALDLPAAILTL